MQFGKKCDADPEGDQRYQDQGYAYETPTHHRSTAFEARKPPALVENSSMGSSSPLVASCTSLLGEFRSFSRSTFMASFSHCPVTPQAPLRKVTTPKEAGCIPPTASRSVPPPRRWMRHPAERKSTLCVTLPTRRLRKVSPEVAGLDKLFANFPQGIILSLESRVHSLQEGPDNLLRALGC